MTLHEELQSLASRGLTFAECARVFGQMQNEELMALGAKAREEFEEEGKLEFDDYPVVSMAEGNEDNGAYVMAWVWVTHACSSQP